MHVPVTESMFQTAIFPGAYDRLRLLEDETVTDLDSAVEVERNESFEISTASRVCIRAEKLYQRVELGWFGSIATRSQSDVACPLI